MKLNLPLGTRIMNSVRDNRILSHEEEERYLPRILLIQFKSEMLVAESHPTLCNPVDSL